jgi:hypothetical protein
MRGHRDGKTNPPVKHFTEMICKHEIRQVPAARGKRRTVLTDLAKNMQHTVTPRLNRRTRAIDFAEHSEIDVPQNINHSKHEHLDISIYHVYSPLSFASYRVRPSECSPCIISFEGGGREGGSRGWLEVSPHQPTYDEARRMRFGRLQQQQLMTNAMSEWMSE